MSGHRAANANIREQAAAEPTASRRHGATTTRRAQIPGRAATGSGRREPHRSSNAGARRRTSGRTRDRRGALSAQPESEPRVDTHTGERQSRESRDDPRRSERGREECTERESGRVRRIDRQTLQVPGIGNIRTEDDIPEDLDIRSCVIVERTPPTRLADKPEPGERSFSTSSAAVPSRRSEEQSRRAVTRDRPKSPRGQGPIEASARPRSGSHRNPETRGSGFNRPVVPRFDKMPPNRAELERLFAARPCATRRQRRGAAGVPKRTGHRPPTTSRRTRGTRVSGQRPESRTAARVPGAGGTPRDGARESATAR